MGADLVVLFCPDVDGGLSLKSVVWNHSVLRTSWRSVPLKRSL